MKDLQNILESWASWKAKKLDTDYKFVEATDYSKHSELKDYHSHQCTVRADDIIYSNNSTPAQKQNTVYSLDYKNNSDVDQVEDFSKDYTTTSSFSWSVTEAVKLGVTVSAKVDVPEIVEVNAQSSVELSLSSTVSVGLSNTSTWRVGTPVTVPPHSEVTCHMIADNQAYNMDFYQDVQVKGDVAVWFKDQVKYDSDDKNKHNLYFMPIGSVFQDVIDHKLADTTGYAVIRSDTITARAKGSFTGDQCVEVHVETVEVPLGGGSKQSNDIYQMDAPSQSTPYQSR